MKKIFNWTFGSVFRTFGRVIAYIIIGTIISLILSNSNFRITDLFLDNVKADTLYTFDTGGITNGWVWDGVLTEYKRAGLGNPEYINGAYYTPQNTLTNITGINKIQINGYFQGLNFSSNLDIDRFQCTSSYNGVCNEYTLMRANVQQFTFQIWTNNHTTQCQLDWNIVDVGQTDYNNRLFWTATCNASALNNISLYVDIWNSAYDGNEYIGINRYVKYWKSDSSTIIDNQNQNTQEIIQSQNQTQETIIQSQNQTQETIINSTNQTISTITDNSSPDINGTLDNNTIAGWLPPGPIDSIVTLPLTLLNSLFNAMGGTCADLVVPLPFVNKNLNIPCMSRIYNDMSFSSFFNWIGVVASAFILYKYLLRLYKWIDATLTLRENTQVDWGGD